MAARKKISYASNYSDNSEKENIKPVANKSLRYDFTHNKNGTMSKSIDAGKCKLMRQAAEQLNSKSAMQIRYLQTLKQVGKSNTKVIFIPDMKNKERVNHLITQGLIN